MDELFVKKDLLVEDLYRKQAVTIEHTATIGEALHKMDDDATNGLLVMSDPETVIGILSLQDIAGAIVPSEMQENVNLAEAMYRPGYFEEVALKLAQRKVTSIMRKDFKTVTRKASIMEIAAEFLQNDLYIVPVVEEGRLLGVVTRTEIKQALARAIDR